MERRRILVAVEPYVLGDTLGRILRRSGLDEVVVVDVLAVASASAGHFDAAVVTAELPDQLGADVVITLPDDSGNAGVGVVRNGSAGVEVDVDGLPSLISLIDEHAHRPSSAAVGRSLTDR